MSQTDIIPPSGGTNNMFPAFLAWGLESLSVGALLDSEADECLIDMTLARQASIPLEPIETTLSAQVLDDHSLGKITAPYRSSVPHSLWQSCGDYSAPRDTRPHGTAGLGQTVVRQARPPCLLVHWADSGLEQWLVTPTACVVPRLRPAGPNPHSLCLSSLEYPPPITI